MGRWGFLTKGELERIHRQLVPEDGSDPELLGDADHRRLMLHVAWDAKRQAGLLSDEDYALLVRETRGKCFFCQAIADFVMLTRMLNKIDGISIESSSRCDALGAAPFIENPTPSRNSGWN